MTIKRVETQLKQLEDALKVVRDEYKDFQDQKKIEDLLTVKFDVESFNEEMLTKPQIDLQALE